LLTLNFNLVTHYVKELFQKENRNLNISNLYVKFFLKKSFFCSTHFFEERKRNTFPASIQINFYFFLFFFLFLLNIAIYCMVLKKIRLCFLIVNNLLYPIFTISYYAWLAFFFELVYFYNLPTLNKLAGRLNSLFRKENFHVAFGKTHLFLVYLNF